MGRETELLLQEVNKRLDNVEAAIIASSGGGGGGATEVTLAAIESKVSTEAEQLLAKVILNDIKTSLLAMKDGEFRIFTDPNDNNRLVALSADMTIPSSPTYVYKYLDNGASYIGNVNDLAQVVNSSQTELLTELQLKADLSETQPVSIATVGRVPTLVRVTDATGSPIVGARKVSIYNAGGANGVVLGAALKPGERVSFEVNLNNTLTAISYDGTGTELSISTIK